jgi:hypothetical protein
MNIVIAASDSGDNRKSWQIYVAWIQAINDHSKRTCSLHTALSCLTCRGWATQTIKRLLCVEKWCGLQVFYYVRGVCREMMWSASVLLRARSVSRNGVVCKCFPHWSKMPTHTLNRRRCILNWHFAVFIYR